MAMVHRMLYEKQELKNLNLKHYTSELVLELFNSYDLVQKLKFSISCQQYELPVFKSVPLGLIINEVVTNSIKYAFKKNGRNSGTFSIEVSGGPSKVQMILSDDGEGFPANFDPNSETLSLGIFLIKSLAEQIDGNVSFSNNNGAQILLEFPLN